MTSLPERLDEEWSLQRDDTPEMDAPVFLNHCGAIPAQAFPPRNEQPFVLPTMPMLSCRPTDPKDKEKKRVANLLGKPSKFGRCPIHGVMLQPWLRKSGQYQGHILLPCRRWFDFKQPAHLRRWHFARMDPLRWKDLPARLRGQCSKLQNAFNRGRVRC